MSDFHNPEFGFDSERHEHERNKKDDDFQRLDDDSMLEQKHDMEKELHVLNESDYVSKITDFEVDSLSSSPTHAANVAASDLIPPSQDAQPASNLIKFQHGDDDALLDVSPMQLDLQNADNRGGIPSSTDRPLVTLHGDPPEAFSLLNRDLDFQTTTVTTTTVVPETTEVHLTPDPDDKLGLGLGEPFVNVKNLIEDEQVTESSHFGSTTTTTTTTTNIYPGKLFNAQGYSINPTVLDDDEDEEIVEEELEDNNDIIRGGGGLSHFSLESGPDVLHPSAPDLISNPYQQQPTQQQQHQHREMEEEDFSDLLTGRDDSPPPRYEVPDDKSKMFIDKEADDKEGGAESKYSSVHKIKEETFEVEEKVEREIHLTSKIEELIEELTPPFAACPSAAPPKFEMAKREEQQQQQNIGSSWSADKCPFSPSAWFNPDKLDPRVADLIYWRNVKKSAITFGVGMVVLLSLSYFSLISVVAYSLLAIMLVTLSYRIYKNILQAVQKSTEGHPFKQYLDIDLSLSRDKVGDLTDNFIKHVECTAKSLRRLFLVEDLVDSLKFAVLLWCFTYIGAWFNGLTLVILGFVALFTLPKVYETYKVQIDHYLHIGCSQINEVMNKIKTKIPIGKKPKQQ